MFSRLRCHFARHARETFAKQVHQVPADTVDRQLPEVVNVHVTGAMSLTDSFWINFVQPISFTNF